MTITIVLEARGHSRGTHGWRFGDRECFLTRMEQLKGLKGVNLKAEAMIWPGLSYLCNIHLIAALNRKRGLQEQKT